MTSRRLVCLTALLAVAACRSRVPTPAPAPGSSNWTEAVFARKPLKSFTLHTGPDGVPKETVVGKRSTYKIRDGDTLLDVARYYDLGLNEITEANPGVDAWIPPVGSTIVLPTEWVLPCCTYEGIVVNIPEMRLYYYVRPPGQRDTVVLHTYPVGLGTDDHRTPRGRFAVRGKTVNPRWNIPASILQEHIRERGDKRTSIAGGDPDNPLGKYRFELTIPRYAIHGTNIPWGIGMLVSHGCSRLYPEDMEQLFPLVPVGTHGEFTYQLAKVGESGGHVYVELHPDIYKYDHLPERALARVLKQRGLAAKVDDRRLQVAPTQSHGMPFRVSA